MLAIMLTRMNMTEIIKKAKTIGIDPGKMKKAELIRSIQTAEGSSPCFGTSDGQCAYAECCFIRDCFKSSLAERKQNEEHLEQQIGDLTAANKQLQQEITERQHAEDELEQYCGRIEQRIEEQMLELVAADDIHCNAKPPNASGLNSALSSFKQNWTILTPLSANS